MKDPKVNPWVWTELTEMLKPDRKAGQLVPVGYLSEGPNEYYPPAAWIRKGYVTKARKRIA